jgi:hypothetical protein
MSNLDTEVIAILEKPEEPNKRWDNIFDDRNAAARMIVANVLRRLICFQTEDYQRARAILDTAEFKYEKIRTIVEEEPTIIAALFACVYDQGGRLRQDDRGFPIHPRFIESKILNLKENPYRGVQESVLRGLFQDLRMKMGGGNEATKYCRQIIRALQRSEIEDEPVEQLAA